MKNLLLFGILLISSFTSCKKEENNNDIYVDKNGFYLSGTWSNPVFRDSLITYHRVNNIGDQYGFSIAADHKFFERKNAGWCGTPPISFTNYEGNWLLQDSILKIESRYWGGKVLYQWRIIHSYKDSLILHPEKDEYIQED